MACRRTTRLLRGPICLAGLYSPPPQGTRKGTPASTSKRSPPCGVPGASSGRQTCFTDYRKSGRGGGASQTARNPNPVQSTRRLATYLKFNIISIVSLISIITLISIISIMFHYDSTFILYYIISIMTLMSVQTNYCTFITYFMTCLRCQEKTRSCGCRWRGRSRRRQRCR